MDWVVIVIGIIFILATIKLFSISKYKGEIKNLNNEIHEVKISLNKKIFDLRKKYALDIDSYSKKYEEQKSKYSELSNIFRKTLKDIKSESVYLPSLLDWAEKIEKEKDEAIVQWLKN